MKTIDISKLENIGVSHDPAIKKRVILGRGELPHLNNLSQVRFKTGQVASSHSHKDMYEVFLIEEGEGTVIFNTEEQRLKKGICVVVEPGELHEVKNTGKSDLVITYFGITA